MCLLIPKRLQWFEITNEQRVVDVVVYIDLQIGYVSNFH